MSAARFRVRGRVQGVGFRAATRQEALRLGLRGQVTNLRDGSVQVIAQGDDAALDALADWLHRGPPHARVDTVAREAFTGYVAEGFGVG